MRKALERIWREIQFVANPTSYNEIVFFMDFKTEPLYLKVKNLLKKLKKENDIEEAREEL